MKRVKTYIFAGVLLLLAFTAKAQSYTISGFVTDGTTKEILIGAVSTDAISTTATTTNSYGFYSLTLPKGSVSLNWSYLGYEPVTATFELTRDTIINVSLRPLLLELEEVVVSANDNNIKNVRPGQVFVPISTIRSKPALMGESDLMKSLQYIPGVQSSTEGKADLSVRGGTPDQNLILLDGNPIYNANHLFGFMSVFNTDALKNVTLYKSGFPARFGGRLSSVIDINTKDGDKQRFGGSATLGLLAAKFSVEGPIVKGRTSFTLSGRRSWADTFMGSLQKSEDVVTTVYFYDLNAKIHHKLSDRTSIYLTAYNGQDKFQNTEQLKDIYPGQVAERNSSAIQDWKWGNTLIAARLNSSLSGNLFMNANLSYNRYRYSTFIKNTYNVIGNDGILERATKRIDYNSGIRDYTGSVEFEYIPSSSHYIRTGAQYIFHDFKPEALSMSGGKENLNGGQIPASEVALYAEDDWDIAERLKLNGGVRFSMFQVRGKTYTGVDPRLSARFMFSDRVSIKAGYTRMQQYIHLLSNNSLMFQTDLWVPSTDRIKPMNSTQYSLGLYVAFPKLFDLSIEGYYKDMNNVLEYSDGASFSGSSSGWENKVEAGIGRSYGVEIALEKRVGTTTGTLSYAWSKSERRFDEINYGEWFPAKFDRRHSINVTVAHKLSKKIDLTASWTLASGDMVTLPLMSTDIANIPDGGISMGGLYQLDHRNNYRMPTYHRLDVGMNFYPRKERNPHRYGVWNFSIYNVYNRMNAFKLFVQEEENGTKKLKKMVMFPILPSVSYTYNF